MLTTTLRQLHWVFLLAHIALSSARADIVIAQVSPIEGVLGF